MANKGAYLVAPQESYNLTVESLGSLDLVRYQGFIRWDLFFFLLNLAIQLLTQDSFLVHLHSSITTDLLDLIFRGKVRESKLSGCLSSSSSRDFHAISRLKEFKLDPPHHTFYTVSKGKLLSHAIFKGPAIWPHATFKVFKRSMQRIHQ